MTFPSLHRGAIATLILYSWTQANAAEPNGFSPEPPVNSPVFPGGKFTEFRDEPPSLNNSVPESGFPLQWGNSRQIPETIEQVYRDQLTQAQSLATQQRYPEAIATLTGIPKNSQHYSLAQHLQQDWSGSLLHQAKQQYFQANLPQAIALLEKIPPTSPMYAQAMTWQTHWQQQAECLNRAILAQEAQEWSDVLDALQPLEETPLRHSVRVQDLRQRAIVGCYQTNDYLWKIAQVGMPETPVPEPLEVDSLI